MHVAAEPWSWPRAGGAYMSDKDEKASVPSLISTIIFVILFIVFQLWLMAHSYH